MKVAVIGAGPAGLSCAYELVKAGVETDVYEAGPVVGGLARTIELWGQRVDLGPHRFFSKDPRVNKLWLEVVGSDYIMVDRLTRILYKNQFFEYPLKGFDVVKKLGATETFRCLLSYLHECLRPGSNEIVETFESWVVRKFGRRLYEIFFKTYSEKLWGIPCTELDADFAIQRIKKFSMLEAIKSALSNNSNNKHKTLVDNFAYPTRGSGTVYERMASYVSGNGGRIHLKTPVKRVLNVGHDVSGLEFEGRAVKKYDHVVSTMPLTLMVLGLDGVPQDAVYSANSLTFRNTILVYLNVRRGSVFPDNWIYIHSPELQLGRVTNFRNWSRELYGDEKSTILALEYWCNEPDALWSADDGELIELGKREISETGLVGAEDIVDGYVQKINKCYPVYSVGYQKKLEPIINYMNEMRGLTAIGRYGSFKYNNQDHSILMGILAADNIVNGANNDLWAINTDYEYQESSLITDTGLVELES
jgi:protoporphyrinogen oxidase